MSDNKEPRPEPRTRSFSDSKSDRISSRIQSLNTISLSNVGLELLSRFSPNISSPGAGLIKTPLGAWISNLTILSMCKMWSLQEILQDHCHIFTRIQNLINHKVSIPKEFKPIIIWEASGIKQLLPSQENQLRLDWSAYPFSLFLKNTNLECIARGRYVDDILPGADSIQKVDEQIYQVQELLATAGFSFKYVVKMGEAPYESSSSDSISIKMLGYKWAAVEDILHPG